MIKPRTYGIYYILVSLSLLLLFAFLVFWNYKNYQEEKELLTERGQLFFENTVRNVEDEFWEKMFLNPTHQKQQIRNFSNGVFEFRSDIQVSNDSTGQSADTTINIVTRIDDHKFGDEERKFRRGPTEIRISSKDTTYIRNFSGMMSLHLIVDEGDTGNVKTELLDSIMFGDITQRLRRMDEGRINVIRIADTTIRDSPTREIITGSYTDRLTGESYAVSISDFQGDIWAKIWPQGLFSLVLFLVTAVAFLFMMRTLINQDRLAVIKNDFISNMTHELKTPITTVGVALEALSNFNAINDPVRSKEYIDISQKELQRLGILVDKVLKMSLFEEAPEIKKETIELKMLVAEVLNSMKLHFEKYNGHYELDFTGADFTLQADKTHMTSVIYNLVDNALKYSPEDPEVNILLEEENDELKLLVRDRGIGIASEYQDKIFDKFFRVPTGDRHTVKGHGLGLAYIHGVIRQHGGEISVESQPGNGTTFIIKLPRKHGKG